jgi:hypothetical protein
MNNITISSTHPAFITFNQEMADNVLAVQILLDAEESYTDEIKKLFARRCAIQTNLIEAATNTNRNDWRFTVWNNSDFGREYSYSFSKETCCDYLDGVEWAFQPDWNEVMAEGITFEQLRDDNAQWNKGMLYSGCAIWVDDDNHEDEGYFICVSEGI